MDQEAINLSRIGRNAVEEWHDKEGVTPEANELLSGLAAFIDVTSALGSTPGFINCIKVALVSAFQIGRESGKNERESI